ncbi:hypothetical protein OHA72_27465 [Dactylosporangium sp. NBC_01737]|nr:hypothetical protein OHA72_27465 [Dactylosporangium sp. NBC_01737]
MGSAFLGSVGPLTAPLFLAAGLTSGAYIGTEAACALVVHVSKLAAYGVGALLNRAAATPRRRADPGGRGRGVAGQKTLGQVSDRWFILFVEASLVAAAALLLVGT